LAIHSLLTYSKNKKKVTRRGVHSPSGHSLAFERQKGGSCSVNFRFFMNVTLWRAKEMCAIP